MKKKYSKAAIALIAGVTAAVMGLATGCGGGDKEPKHHWEWDWSATEHWQYCTDDGCDETTAKAPHKDADNDGKCDDCKQPMQTTPPSHTHSYTEWGSNDTQHWKYCKDDNAIDESTRANHNYVDGKCECGKADPNANQGGETTGKNEYTIYLYAPEANGAAVTVTVWSPEENPNGLNHEFTDKSAMTAVAGKTGWYSFTFKTDKDITNGANFNLYVGDDQVATGYTNAADWVYFAAGKNDVKWNSMTDAEAAYNGGGENPNPGGDEFTETATIHFHKPADFGDKVYAHAYYNDGTGDKDLTGAWKSYEVTTTDADGWYTIEVKHPDNLFDGGSFNLMIVREDDSSISVTINAAEMWVNANGNLFASKAEAVADEAAEETEYAIYYYAPDWVEGENVYVYTYGGPIVGEYNTEMPADGADGWYKITFKTTLDLTSFNVMFHTLDESIIKRDLPVTVTEALAEGKAFYFISNSNTVYESKDAAKEAYNTIEAGKDQPKAYSYTFYMYAPEASSVTIATWASDSAFAGEIADGTPMTAVDGHDGWYSYTLETNIQIKEGNGINLNIYVDGENKGKYSETETDLYFIPVGNDRGFTSFEDAEAKYEELTNVDPDTLITMTIHFQKPDTWGANLGAYIYGDVGELLGGFWDTTMDYADGWYTVTVSEIQNGATFSLIVFDRDKDSSRIEKPFTAAADLYINADGNVTTAPNA